MRQDRIFARILLIFSVTNVALAAPAVVRQRHLDVVAKAASEKRQEKRAPGDGATGETLPPEDHPIWGWLKNADPGPPSPDRTPGWPEPVSPPAMRIIPGQGWELPSFPTMHNIPAHGWPTSPSPPPTLASYVIPPAPQGEWRSSSFTDTSLTSSSEGPLLPPHHQDSAPVLTAASGPDRDPLPPSHHQDSAPELTAASGSNRDPLLPSHHQDSAPVLTAAPESGANRFISDSLKHKILVSSGVIGVIGGAAALAYGIQQWVQHPYVSPLPTLHPADIQPGHKHSDLRSSSVIPVKSFNLRVVMSSAVVQDAPATTEKD